MAAIIRTLPPPSAVLQSADEDVAIYQRYLSPFQIEKFTYMFTNFFDNANEDGLLQKDDIKILLYRLRRHRRLEKRDDKFLRIQDVMNAFYDCLTDEVRVEKGCSATAEGFACWNEALKPRKINTENISINQWLNMWGRLCRGAAGISGFPFWVQLLGHIFFDTIDQDQDGVLGIEEFKNFYRNMTEVQESNLDKVTEEGYRVLTANYAYELNRDNYMFCFANFLLAKDIYGPGKYIFGIFDNREINESFKVQYNDDED